jgi:predicted nuclease with RNAse H fold
MMMRRSFVGIDVAARRPMDVAVLDARLRVLALERVSGPEAVAAYVIEHWPHADVAIDSPPCHAHRLLPAKDYRVSEWELMRRGIALYPTPPRDARPWMQAGFRLFERLKAAGWRHFEGEPMPDGPVVCEYYPYAAFCALAGAFVPRKNTPAGRTRRLELLAQAGVAGNIAALRVDQIDALAGAVTARRLRAGRAAWYGDRREGVLVTPNALWAPGEASTRQ